ncbi:MAG TPA: methylenetetrahydrofolate reductase [NAD(P)H] [Cryomorphaceae bacterium]|mgnify:CR=1 FL=1|nr:methylenetetrahydrofolate reductase [NAD(P)H] [Owenweeksia sp.]MBF99996.1 methylenetetrahydrofolate reductase [NAD(P)H] [Owenweeksia sp.]HAD97213.1 methylenetetrahydrofolate reductase [NAD(P)H] [Cryomorphaceae bacterium]HBF21440.1 methylenetetrahydrofolate reductase [NAD(P)H] [Cryomorphaceae bacterium]HCQ15356.1 methylenetetrahydrofolate reductase [NAD(P)H] [Cryomorphaceae bacterium]|tara:strand:- start:1312 stop:2265 length:954 start_codon:yes stop_codon:yes gene_type:complete
MKVIEHIKQAKETIFSFEILPPLKGQNIRDIYNTIDPLMEFKPPFVNVTYHREEVVYKRLNNGLLEQKVVRKRPGTVGICAALQNRYKIDAVPHILCGGFSREDTENALIDLDFLGIENVLALRGDSIKGETYFVAEKNGHTFACDLVGQISDMNKGIYLDEELKNNTPTNFCIGVAGYPEKHFEAPSINNDVQNTLKKVQQGAEYIVTQLFFDNTRFFEYVEKCRQVGISVPIIPGIKPIATKRHLSLLPHRFHVDIPDELVKSVVNCRDNEQVREVGVEWAIQQCKELKEAGVPVLHFYSMGKVDNIQTIAKAVF